MFSDNTYNHGLSNILISIINIYAMENIDHRIRYSSDIGLSINVFLIFLLFDNY